MSNDDNRKYINRAVCDDGFHRMDDGTCMPGLTHPKLSDKQWKQYKSLLEITDEYGKYAISTSVYENDRINLVVTNTQSGVTKVFSQMPGEIGWEEQYFLDITFTH